MDTQPTQVIIIAMKDEQLSQIGFQVYIDESGDEGFVFRDGCNGSSRWFVLSAVIIRKELDLGTVKLIDRVRADLRYPECKSLHFRNMKHEHRLPFLARIVEARLRTVSVLIHKPSLAEPEKFAEKSVLYRYATRYLLERVSWCCRDHRKAPHDSAKIVFSNRANMSYDELRDYLGLLKNRSDIHGVRIDWSVIRCDRIVAEQHERLMGLQIADAVASGMWYGVEKTHHGFTEPRYAEMLAPVVYRYQGRHLGYGIKFWPREVSGLLSERPELAWISKTYQ